MRFPMWAAAFGLVAGLTGCAEDGGDNMLAPQSNALSPEQVDLALGSEMPGDESPDSADNVLNVEDNALPSDPVAAPAARQPGSPAEDETTDSEAAPQSENTGAGSDEQ